MIVRELIKYLADFNPNANVNVVVDNIAERLTDGGWDGPYGDLKFTSSNGEIRDILGEKLNASDVNLHLLKDEKLYDGRELQPTFNTTGEGKPINED